MCQHRCLISFLLLSYKDFATMVTWHHTSPLYNGLAIWQQMTYTVLNLLFHWSPLICTSIVFRDRGIVMSQSLLFSQLITVFQIGADHPATVPQHPKTLKLLSSPTGFYTSVCSFIVRCSSHYLHQAVEWPGNSSSSTHITGCTTELT